MKNALKLTLTIIILNTIIGCSKNSHTCACIEDYPQMENPYTPEGFTLSWSEYNPLIRVQEYFCYHDSTLHEHDGDTIMLYGYISKVNVRPVGDWGYELIPIPYDSAHENNGCGFCFEPTLIGCQKRPVEDWMTEPDRLIYVKGIIKCLHPNYDLHYKLRVDAIQYDSVKFDNAEL